MNDWRSLASSFNVEDDSNVDGIQIPFSLDRSILPMSAEFNLPHRLKFWDIVIRPWLQERGYTMYEFGVYDEETLTWCYTWPSIVLGVEPPKNNLYAFYDPAADPSELLVEMNPPAYALDSMGRVGYAQDEQHRHVALKLVASDSSEIQILQLLFKKQKLFTGNIIPGLVPILDLLPFGGHWLVVMPRWGLNPMRPWFNTLGEVLVFVRSLLQGLVSLHSYRVVHQDLAYRNMLMNHFSISEQRETEMRHDLRRENRAQYALYDFDLSRIIPPGTDRLSYKEFPVSTQELCQLDDLHLGQYEFDPFACDVALLGLFLSEIDYLAPMAPFLAPLIDGMLTWQVEKRLTAQEALRFFDEMSSELTATDLGRPSPEHEGALDIDHWAGISPELTVRWAHMRTPPRPLRIYLLRTLCKCRPGRFLTRTVRRVINRIQRKPRFDNPGGKYPV